MRTLLIAISIAVVFATVALAADRITCEKCGMFWDNSASRIEATFKGDSKVHHFESIGCLYQTQPDKSKLASVKMLDYSTLGGSEKLIDAKSAHFLYDTDRLAHSMPPFTAAFSSKDAATKAKDKLGGTYVTFDGLWKKLAERFKKAGH